MVTVHDFCPADRSPWTSTVPAAEPGVAVADPHVVVYEEPACVSSEGRFAVNDQPFFASRSVVLVRVKVTWALSPTGVVPVVDDENFPGLTGCVSDAALDYAAWVGREALIAGPPGMTDRKSVV